MVPCGSSVGVLAVAAFLALGVSAVAGLDSPAAISIDDYIRAELSGQKLPGLSLAVIKDGQFVKARGYGLANLELSVAATPDSVYEIASLTKQFTATAVVMLANEKKFALDDPVSRFVTEIPETWRNVTIRHLLTHTSGIPSHTEMATAPVAKVAGKGYTRAELIAHVAKEPVKFRPGEGWAYNDFGYYLLGMIVEKASGVPYATYMTEHIFRPLGMASTRIYDPTDIVPNRVSGYIWKDQRFRRGKLSQTGTFGSGDILSTANDLAKWDIALDGDKLLPFDLRQQLWTPARLNDGRIAPFSLPIKAFRGSSYGFGWMTGSLRGHRIVAHGVDISSGFSTYIVRFLDDRLSVIVLMNRSQSDDPFGLGAPRPFDIAHRVASYYLPDLRGSTKTN